MVLYRLSIAHLEWKATGLVGQDVGARNPFHKPRGDAF